MPTKPKAGFGNWHIFFTPGNMPSTVIARIEYDTNTSVLLIEFRSGLIYEYLNVPEKIYQALKHSRTKGIYFNQQIKPLYASRKLGQ